MEKNTQTNQPAQESSEVRYQFDTTLGQATIDGNLMPVMLFALRRGNRGAWLYGRIAIIVIALALCLLRIQLLTMIALLIVASSLWDLYNLSIKGLQRQLRACIRFAKQQGKVPRPPESRVRVFFSDAEFSVWDPDQQRKLLSFPLNKLYVVESEELFFITFEERSGRRWRRNKNRTTTVVRKDAITYGTVDEFRSFLQGYCKAKIKLYDIHFPAIQDLLDELNRSSLGFSAQPQS